MMLAVVVTVMVMAAIIPSTVTKEINRPLASGPNNDTRVFSPIVMCRTWPTLARLAINVFSTIFGMTMNGYYIATFFIAKEVRKIGNVFLVCVGLADSLITGGVMITSDVALLSGQVLDTPPVCQGVQTLVATSTYCYSLFFTLVALVAWFRVNQTRKICRKYLAIFVGLLCCMVFVVGFALAFAGTYFDLDDDYCQRKHHGNYYYRMGTASIHGIASCFTVTIFIASYLKLKRRNKGNGRYRRSYQFIRDISLIKLNLVMYLFYILLWVPYLTVVNFYPDAPDWLYYQSAWLAILRSLLSSMFYGLSNNIFARSYSSLFNYCWCKISIKTLRSRQGRTGNGNFTRNKCDLRTHILIQQAAANGQDRQDL